MHCRDRLSLRDNNNLLLYHMANDRLSLDQLVHDMDIPTLYKGNPPLKVNRYSNGVGAFCYTYALLMGSHFSCFNL